MSPAEHPMPPRLYVLHSGRSPNRRATDAAREGVGQKRLQFTTRKSISRGRTADAARAFSTHWNIVISAITRAPEGRGAGEEEGYGVQAAESR